MRFEHHITVNGDPFQWRGWCANAGIKSLWIELNNFDRQLMCAITGSDLERECIPDVLPYVKDMTRAGFEIIRHKHELEVPKIDISTHGNPNQFLDLPVDGALYYEVHVKLDGPFNPRMPKASRDLFQKERWYVTLREPRLFDYAAFVNEVAAATAADCTYVGYEYEACVLDTNVMLDKGWR